MKPLYYNPDGSPKTPPACFNFDRDLALAECARLEHERDEARRVVRVLAYVLSESTLVPGLNDAILTVESWGDE